MARWLEEVELRGEGVLLEPLRTEHVEPLIEAAADGELWRLWYTNVPTIEGVEAYVAEALCARERGAALPFAIRLERDGRIVGSTRFCNVAEADQRAEIGYTWLSESVQRSFVNTACKLLLLGHVFEERDAIAIEFRTHWHNTASRRAIARLGAKQDGVLRQHRQEAHGGYRDTVVFSILNSEWPTVRQGLRARLAAGT